VLCLFFWSYLVILQSFCSHQAEKNFRLVTCQKQTNKPYNAPRVLLD